MDARTKFHLSQIFDVIFMSFTDSFSENQEFVLFGADSHVFIGPSFDITPRSIWLDRLSLF